MYNRLDNFLPKLYLINENTNFYLNIIVEFLTLLHI